MLAIGLAIIGSIFVFLILDGENWDIVSVLEILLLGLYFVPNLISSINHYDEAQTKFAKNFAKYVLGTLLILAFAIIYLYILKIFIYRIIPNNQIFRILASLFIVGCPIWSMINSFGEDNIIDKISKILPLLFIPFIFLQIYSIGLRIANNGLTEARYLGVVLILCEIIYTIMYIVAKKHIGKILLVLSAFATISIIVPYINMFTMSEFSQINNLKIFTQKAEYTEEEKDKILGAYNYLSYRKHGQTYVIDEILNKEQKEKIDELEYDKNDNTYENNADEYISLDDDITSLNIEGYNKLYKISAVKYRQSDNESLENIFSNFELTLDQNDSKITINILPEITKFINMKAQKQFEENNEIIIDENRKIIFTQIYINYNKETNEVFNYNISGYLLEK